MDTAFLDTEEQIGQQTIRIGDCQASFPELMGEGIGTENTGTIDIICTSPPYNLKVNYGRYNDDRPRDAYLRWMNEILDELHSVLKRHGSFFLNLGASCRDPWIATDVAVLAREYFTLQNQIIWTKHLTVGETGIGHVKPINSRRYLNHTFEHLFHFTHQGDVPLDRLAIGVPYTDKSNLNRGSRGKHGDVHCRGNTWYLPYDTVQSREEKGGHPAIYPVKLAEWCLKLHGLREGLRVLDPFAGTGTTAVACRNLGVAGLHLELDEAFLPRIRARLGA